MFVYIKERNELESLTYLTTKPKNYYNNFRLKQTKLDYVVIITKLLITVVNLLIQ